MTTLRALAVSAAVLAALASFPAAAGAGAPSASDPLRLAMMDNMGAMQPQGGGMGQGGGMMMDNMMGMGTQPQGRGGGMQAPGSPGQGGMQQGAPGQGGMQPGQTGGMMMHDMMMGGMQQGQQGQMPMQGRMPGTGMGQMPGMAPGGVDLTDRIEGRIAFLRTELGIGDAQAAAWNQFADALRGSRRHLLEARQVLHAGMPAGDAAARLQQYEQHVAARLEAIKAARTSFAQLYAVLDDRQKETADELLVPFIATF
jgi:hypothetical protein